MGPAAAAVKVVVVGPTKGGKTSIANFLAGQTEAVGHPTLKYEPTVGVRYAPVLLQSCSHAAAFGNSTRFLWCTVRLIRCVHVSLCAWAPQTLSEC
jgi:hypothetical protein